MRIFLSLLFLIAAFYARVVQIQSATIAYPRSYTKQYQTVRRVIGLSAHSHQSQGKRSKPAMFQTKRNIRYVLSSPDSSAYDTNPATYAKPIEFTYSFCYKLIN